MSHRLHPAAAFALAVVLSAAAVVFFVLNAAFGGPSPVDSGPSAMASARFADVQGLVTKSLVMVRGVPVGEVSRLQRVGGKVDVSFAVDRQQVRVHRDATVRVGHRTLFGEAYLDLDPGRRSAGPLPQGGRLPDRAVRPSVRLDDALKAFGPRTRARIRSLNATAAAIDRDPRARADLNATLHGLAGTLEGLRTLTRTLGGQEEDLRRFVSGSRVVVDELAGREEQVRTLVTSGRMAAEAATADAPALRETLAETAGLLNDARATLVAARPLLRRAGPVIDAASAAAPDLTRALLALRPVARSGGTLIRRLPAFTRTATPVLRRLSRVAPQLGTTLAALEPALRDLGPVVRHAADYRRELQGFFTLGTTAAVLRDDGTTSPPTLEDARTAHPFSHPGEDAPYAWARFLFDGNTGALTATPNGIGTDPYPDPASPFVRSNQGYDRVQPDPLPAP